MEAAQSTLKCSLIEPTNVPTNEVGADCLNSSYPEASSREVQGAGFAPACGQCLQPKRRDSTT